MRIFFSIVFLCCCLSVNSQILEREGGGAGRSSDKELDSREKDSLPTIDLFKIISVDNDTTQVDTSLTIQKDYCHLLILAKRIIGLPSLEILKV